MSTRLERWKSCCLFWWCILNASAHKLVYSWVFRETYAGIRQDEAQWWCFTVWTTSMLLGVYTRHLGTLWPVFSCHGGMGSPLSAHWWWCQEDSDLLEDFVKYLWCHMDEYGWFWMRLVFCVLESVCHALYNYVLDFCVFGLGLFSCFGEMPVWCHINQSINQSKPASSKVTSKDDSLAGQTLWPARLARWCLRKTTRKDSRNMLL